MEVRTDLLDRLADHLVNDVPRDCFDLNIWGQQNGVFCGCAIGWGAQFMEEIEIEPSFCDVGDRLLYFMPKGTWASMSTAQALNHVFKVVGKIFNITDKESQFLFAPKHYEAWQWRDPVYVASRIREFSNECKVRAGQRQELVGAGSQG